MQHGWRVREEVDRPSADRVAPLQVTWVEAAKRTGIPYMFCPKGTLHASSSCMTTGSLSPISHSIVTHGRYVAVASGTASHSLSHRLLDTSADALVSSDEVVDAAQEALALLTSVSDCAI